MVFVKWSFDPFVVTDHRLRTTALECRLEAKGGDEVESLCSV